MTQPTPLYARCGLDLEHEAHPNPAGGMCDGQPTPPPVPDAEQPTTLAGLFLTSPTPRPWVWSALPAPIATELAERLHGFAGWLNRLAVTDEQLVLPCWPEHEQLAWDLAALWAGWVEANLGLGATAQRAMEWWERWLPHFRARLREAYGVPPDACTAGGGHRSGWRACEAAAARVARAQPQPAAEVARALAGGPPAP